MKKLFLLTFAVLLVSTAMGAFSNIDVAYPWAWNDTRGWLNMNDDSITSVEVTNGVVKGYGFFNNSPGDWVSFDCATSPNGNICSISDYEVSNDGSGNLSGWAWNDAIGWISFCGGNNTANCPGSVSYKVTINLITGFFNGWAWNDTAGWISFNCEDPNVCGVSDYKTRTSWVDEALAKKSGFVVSNTYDTGVEGGAAYNSLMWIGELGQTGNQVRLRFATSDCENGATNAPTCDDSVGWTDAKLSGDGAFVGPTGTSGSEDFYEPGPSIPAPITSAYHNNKRYYRYKLFLDKPAGNLTPPTVEDVIINWSR